MSTAEIIAELPHLSEAELALIQTKLCELVSSTQDFPTPPRIRTPRLVHLEQSKDFIKQIVELTT